MPRIKAWADYHSAIVKDLADRFVTFPEGVDHDALRDVQERINNLWISEDGTWEDFQKACGEFKMIFWRVRGK